MPSPGPCTCCRVQREWRECVRAEAVHVGAETPELLFDRLSKTRAVVEESLRLYPPLAAISRMARSSDELAGMRVEAGTIVAIAPYVLHRHKMWGTRADEFDPARFLPGSREYIDRYTYLPFGAGRGAVSASFLLFRRQRSRLPPLRGISKSK